MEHLPLDLPDNPKLAGNITHFARALRRAGLPIGPGRVIDAIRAVEVAGFTDKTDFYWTLHACFVNRPEHRTIFAQLFRLYWRDPRYLEHMMAAMLPAIRSVQEDRPATPAEKRAAEALLDGAEAPERDDQPEPEETRTAWSSRNERALNWNAPRLDAAVSQAMTTQCVAVALPKSNYKQVKVLDQLGNARGSFEVQR